MKHIREMKGANEEVLFINVLSPEEYRKGHIPNSINIPLEGDEDFVQRVEKVAASKNRKIVVYCGNAACNASTLAARQLDQKGFSYVMDFDGGLQEWIHEGGKVEKGKPRAKALTR